MTVSFPANPFHPERSPRFEASAALQGNQLGLGGRSAFLDSTLIEETAAMLRTIREQIPAVRRVFTAATPFRLDVAVSPELGARLGRSAIRTDYHDLVLPMRDGIPVSGVAPFDSLTRRFGVSRVYMWPCEGKLGQECFVDLTFSHFMNVPVVAAAYKRLPGVVAAWPPSSENLMYTDIHLAFADSAYRTVSVLFDEGRGDCPAGCIGYVKSLVRFDLRTRQARLVQQDSL